MIFSCISFQINQLFDLLHHVDIETVLQAKGEDVAALLVARVTLI